MRDKRVMFADAMSRVRDGAVLFAPVYCLPVTHTAHNKRSSRRLGGVGGRVVGARQAARSSNETAFCTCHDAGGEAQRRLRPQSFRLRSSSTRQNVGVEGLGKGCVVGAGGGGRSLLLQAACVAGVVRQRDRVRQRGEWIARR